MKLLDFSYIAYHVHYLVSDAGHAELENIHVYIHTLFPSTNIRQGIAKIG